jgi:hypothetical protein
LKRKELFVVITIALIGIAAGAELIVANGQVLFLEGQSASAIQVVLTVGSNANLSSASHMFLNFTEVGFAFKRAPGSNTMGNMTYFYVQKPQIIDFVDEAGKNVSLGYFPSVPPGIITEVQLVALNGTATSVGGPVALKTPATGHLRFFYSFVAEPGGFGTLSLTLNGTAVVTSYYAWRFQPSFAIRWTEASQSFALPVAYGRCEGSGYCRPGA